MKIKIVLLRHKWADSEVAKQLGEQYIDDSSNAAKMILNAIYRLSRSTQKAGVLLSMRSCNVWSRLKKWGFETRLGAKEEWTEEEETLLRRLYPQVASGRCHTKYVAKALKRSIASVSKRAAKLGIAGVKKVAPEIAPYPKYWQTHFCWPWSFHPHPRGSLGKVVTQETRDKISEKNSGKVRSRESVERGMKTKIEKYGSGSPPNVHGSWKSAWREIGGKRGFYRSAWEANYARYLEFLKVNNSILDWEHEPFTFWFTGVKRGCVSYLPDFRITNMNSSQEYHEVKGWMDDRSATKIKRMAKYFPEIKLLVIDAAWFKRNARKLRGLIPGWETMRNS